MEKVQPKNLVIQTIDAVEFKDDVVLVRFSFLLLGIVILCSLLTKSLSIQMNFKAITLFRGP